MAIWTSHIHTLLVLLLTATVVKAEVDQKARIILASLLGGVPGLGIILLVGFCIWIRKKKRRMRKEALAAGIPLDHDGWPVKNYVPSHVNSLRTSDVSAPVPPYSNSTAKASRESHV
ncbi:hypothetical protein FRC03_009209 [Tulasnella sp. 419]|nr:hypothetical protein FRC02_006039 [Tulasnella sp. 418]KAG8958349.1 hypothetical protein FRC03_009209 [Tulasnella sp. 419]